ncbi:MAG: hypothetical protein MUF49_13435 [Oculatellaceae cyanobacterium Prado106]|jgi:Ca2+-binding RTX toxin-like protein|nr:hypothetical protein [Oculatellaceae cyanobacterium Prado106]
MSDLNFGLANTYATPNLFPSQPIIEGNTITFASGFNAVNADEGVDGEALLAGYTAAAADILVNLAAKASPLTTVLSGLVAGFGAGIATLLSNRDALVGQSKAAIFDFSVEAPQDHLLSALEVTYQFLATTERDTTFIPLPPFVLPAGKGTADIQAGFSFGGISQDNFIRSFVDGDTADPKTRVVTKTQKFTLPTPVRSSTFRGNFSLTADNQVNVGGTIGSVLGGFPFVNDNFSQATFAGLQITFETVPLPPLLATLLNDGQLRLNMGPFANERNISPEVINEKFLVTGESGNVTVSAFDRQENYSNVSNVIADGGTGNDEIVVRSSRAAFVGRSDELNGGDGDDFIAPDLINTTVDGGNGDDTVSYLALGDSAQFALNVDLSNNPFATLVVTFQTPIGTSGTALTHTLQNTENVEGTNRGDSIRGNAQNNLLRGFEGDDRLNGERGNDILDGGKGNDVLEGGTGQDQFVLAPGNGTDTITDFRVGEDQIQLSGGLTFNQLNIKQGTGDNSNDTLIRVSDSDGELLAILKETDAESLKISIQTQGMSGVIQGTSSSDVLYGSGSSQDIISGGDGSDTLYGNGGKDILVGGAGNDQIFGGSDADTMLGGLGDDILYGNGGGDFIDSGSGLDTIWLGGAATVVLSEGFGYDTINNFQLGATRLRVSSLSSLQFGDSAEGAQIFQGNDLLAVVSWQSANTFRTHLNQIFIT